MQGIKRVYPVELIVVVVILGILVPIAVLYNAQTEKKGNVFANQRMIESAAVQYTLNNDMEPDVRIKPKRLFSGKAANMS